jgi:triacylglycerol lipase
MSALGLIMPGTPGSESSTQSLPDLDIQFQDTLAAGQRLWVRGRLVGRLPSRTNETKRWWKRWRKEDPLPPAPLLLQTEVSGCILEGSIPVLADGRFEATFDLNLPAARRGWRVARNRVGYRDRTAEHCNVVLLPPSEAKAAAVIVLPFESTWRQGGVAQLATAPGAIQVPQLLKRLQQLAGNSVPVYYLTCVPLDSNDRRPEFALAAAALGWPIGHFILLPSEARDRVGAMETALDRLRWLFAGSFDLWLINMEAETTGLVDRVQEPKEDRSLVRELRDRRKDSRVMPDHRRDARMRTRGDQQRLTRGARLPRHPIVFCHGMLAFSMLRMHVPEDQNYFASLGDFLRQRGFRVLFPEVPATSGVRERAASLKDQILRWTDEPVNLIGHSMGGLDARYMTTHLQMARHVKSLTTVCTPHRGTYLADWFVANYRQRVPLLVALETFGLNVDGFRDCRPEVCKAFNVNTPDSPEVHYFSFGGEVSPDRLTPMLRRAWTILTPVEGPNDGLVSVASSRWGEYLGTLHADHFAQTPDAVFVRTGEDFDSVGFYSHLVENLARRGF